MKMIILTLLNFLIFLLTSPNLNAQKTESDKNEARIQSIIKQLTLEEKIALLHANSVFGTSGVDRLNIPGLYDG
jgi:beta-glucosidase